MKAARHEHHPEDHLEDHAFGLELQITELVERRERAVVQRDPVRAAALEVEIEQLQEELVATSDQIADLRDERGGLFGRRVTQPLPGL